MNANRYKKYTNDDIEVIKRCIREYPIQKEAFMQASIELNRTLKSIYNVYANNPLFTEERNNKRNIKKEYHNTVKDTLIEEITANPTNLQAAFRATSERTGLSVSTINRHYYGNSTNCLSRQSLGVCFALTSGDKTVYNSKNTNKNQPKVNKKKNNKFIEFFKSLFK